MADTETDRLRELVREALVDEQTVGAEPHDGYGAVIIPMPEAARALLWIRPGADDERPALLQAEVPFDDQPVDAPDEAIAAAVEWLEASRGRWSVLEDTP